MNILLVAPSFRMGGTERVAAQLSRLWTQMGHRVFVATRLPASLGEYAHICQERIVIADWRRDLEVFKGFCAKAKIEFVVWNESWGVTGFECAISCIKKELKIRSAYIHHVTFYLPCNQYDYRYEDALRQFDYFICVSRYLAVWWRSKGLNAIYIRNPVDAIPVECVNAAKTNELVWVGRPQDPLKRLPLMLEMFKEIGTRIPDCKLVIFGVCSEAVQKRLLKMMDNRTKTHVEFRGFISSDKEKFAGATVHVMTTVAEAAPQVIDEARANAVPTLALELPIFRQMSEENGVVKAGSPRDFIDKCVELLTDRLYWKRIAEAALTQGRRNFDTSDMRDKWAMVFADQCDKSVEMGDFDLEDYAVVIQEAQRGEVDLTKSNNQGLSFLTLMKLNAKWLRAKVTRRKCL